MKWCYVSDRKVSFTQSTLFRNHLRGSTKKFLNKTCDVLSLDVQFPVSSEWEACLSGSSIKQQRPTALFQKYCAPKNQRASEDNLHKYVKAMPRYAYLNASVLLSSNYNKHPQSILWDKWNLSYPRICQV